MIAALTGRIARKTADQLVLDVSGVGYQVHIPLSTYYSIPEEGGEVTLHIHTHVREDSLSLFGFADPAEKEMFLFLMSVSGIGPKLALAVLSSLSVQDLAAAILGSDDSKLYAIPGIGKKTAARMVLELKDKIKQLASASSASTAKGSVRAADGDDAISALVNLGYKRPLAEDAVRKVLQIRPELMVEGIIKQALGLLMRK